MSLPYFPFFVADYTVDTQHLSLEEHGAYLRLLCLCWTTSGCTIPDDAAWIRRRLGVDVETYARVVDPLLAEFFKRSGERVFSPRLLSIHLETNDKHTRRVEAGKKGGRPAKGLKEKQMDESNAQALPKQPEPEPEPEREEGATAPCPTPSAPDDARGDEAVLPALDEEPPPPSSKPRRPSAERFEEFWHNAYPHGDEKVGKAKCLVKYKAFVRDGVPEQAILDGARRYRRSEKVQRGFVKLPLTWLNGRHWEDEFSPGAVLPFPQQTPTKARNNGNDWTLANEVADRLAAMADCPSQDALPPLLPARH